MLHRYQRWREKWWEAGKVFEGVYGLSYFPGRVDIPRTHTNTPTHTHKQREKEKQKREGAWGQDEKEMWGNRKKTKGKLRPQSKRAYEHEFMSPAPCGRCGADWSTVTAGRQQGIHCSGPRVVGNHCVEQGGRPKIISLYLITPAPADWHSVR